MLLSQSHVYKSQCCNGNVADTVCCGSCPAVQGDIEARLSAAAHQMLDAFEALLAQLLQPTAPTAATSPTPTPVCPSPLNASLTRYVSTAADSEASKPSVARSLFPLPGGAFAQGSANSFTGPSTGPSSAPGSITSQGSSPVSSRGSASPLAQQAQPSLASLLVAFDDSWLEYLDQFVVWKGRDAVGLEQELMRMAVRLERSMRLKLGRRELDSPEVRANPDLQVRAWRARGSQHSLRVLPSRPVALRHAVRYSCLRPALTQLGMVRPGKHQALTHAT